MVDIQTIVLYKRLKQKQALFFNIFDHQRSIILTNPVPDNTRDRLLVQAEQLFAQRGYAAVSVREITAAADSNLAAVNYHFGNKMNLYLSVFKERWVPRAEGVRNFFRKYLSEKNNPDTADMVRAIATAFLEGAMTDNERRCHINLMLRELTHPTEAINIVVSEVIRPMHHNIRELIRIGGKFMNMGEDRMYETIRFWTMSVAEYLDEYFETDVIKAALSGS